MGEDGRDISGYRGMWIMAMFDLPVDTKSARRKYTRFRKRLIKEGFSMLQFSVYARYFTCEDAISSYRRRILEALPPRGEVRLVAITDRQFGKMEIFIGQKPGRAEEPPSDLLLF